MDVSVVIPVLNGAQVIQTQLAALAAQVTTREWEVVVADNGSTDTTREVVQAWAADQPMPVRIVDASQQRGTAHACNRGIEASTGSIVTVCACDDRVSPQWIEAAWLGTRDADMVGGLVRLLTDPFDEHSRIINPGCLVGKEYKAALGGACAFRRDHFLALGGYDTALPSYGLEDIEFSIRWQHAGYTLAAQPDLVLYFRPTTDLRVLIRKLYLSGKSEVHVWHKWGIDHAGRPHSVASASLRVARWPVDAIRGLANGEAPRSVLRDLITRCGHVAGLHELRRSGEAP